MRQSNCSRGTRARTLGFRHTPGPWFHSDFNVYRILAHCDVEGDPDGYDFVIVEVVQGQPTIKYRPEQSEANARLIATAPWMVELIELAREIIEGSQMWTEAEGDWLAEYEVWRGRVPGKDEQDDQITRH